MRSLVNRFAVLAVTSALLIGCGGGGNSTGPTGPSGPPVVLAINGATLPAGTAGSTVIIEGSNFGTTQGTSQVLFSNGTGGTVTAAIASSANWSDGFIVTAVPAGAATGNVVVKTSLGASTPIVFTLTQNAPFSPSTVSWTA